MIIGAHIMIDSSNDNADRKFLTEVLKLQSIDAGGGYMIFGIPPAELSVHGSGRNDVHTLYFMCDDIAAFTGEMTRHGIAFSTPVRESWGTATEIALPSGGKLGVYQPRHKRPAPAGAKPAAKRKSRKPAKKAAKAAARKRVAKAVPPKKKKPRSKKRR